MITEQLIPLPRKIIPGKGFFQPTRQCAYRLDLKIPSLKIVIDASSGNGAFYALQTLKQLINLSGDQLPVLAVEDSPELPFRGFHSNMALYTPSFESMKRIIADLAKLKINAFVIEYDDRFPWHKHPDIVNPEHFTIDQIRELQDLASDNFIELIPLLDSLGHAEQYLKHSRYKHLRELPEPALCDVERWALKVPAATAG